ncbi:CDP-diacylglycerol--serine O-phosphatidyltransferase [Psychromonas sp. B3M02]|uniref:CDP-diacylglycerol--serine O-phosphatidyltransferase n=1 Tax=unclassified Psychromonas TaxID=2614957 RepID=UPI000DE9D735|nr:CDP-diacylglycerol--serine O-phosphatidyltransferase [Psychromonas sp. B3M02]RBW47158.1 CDP-diacylglycerol--serine O-phosphatidyltransferase [Psychromonas sp. B3M02]
MSKKINQSFSFLKKLKKLPISADNVKCLLSTDAFKTELFAQINNATQRIYIAALYLEADEAGEQVLNALYKAKQNHPALDITVCIDFHRAQRGLIGAAKGGDTNTTWYQKMAEINGQGVKIVGLPVKRKELFGVQHLKGFIFDDLVFYSGASINNIYLHQQERYRFDRYWLIKDKALADTMVDYLKQVIVNSEAVVQLNSPYVPRFNELKKEHKNLSRNLKSSGYRFLPEKTDGLAIRPLTGIGTKKNLLNKVIRGIFHSTEQELILFTPYFNLPTALSRDISTLLKRKVKITIVVGDKTANDFYIPEDKPFKTIAALPYLYEVNLRNFAKKHHTSILQGNLKLHLWKHDTNSFHLKGIYSDQRFSLLTGHNLNPRAWRLDLENGLLVDDPKKQLTEQLNSELENILTHTRLIESYQDIDDMVNYPDKVKQLISRLKRVKADRIIKGII